MENTPTGIVIHQANANRERIMAMKRKFIPGKNKSSSNALILRHIPKLG